MQFFSWEAQTPTAQGGFTLFSNPAIGSTTASNRLRIDSNGATLPAAGALSWGSSATLTGTPTLDTVIGRNSTQGAYLSNGSVSTPPIISSSTALDVIGQSNTASVRAITVVGTASGSAFTTAKARGTLATPSGALSADSLGSFLMRGYGATAFGSSVGFMTNAWENWNDSAQGTYSLFTSIAIGSTSAVNRLRIDSNGLTFPSAGTLSWGSSATITGTPTLDTRISRLAAGSLSLDTTTTGNGLGSLTGVTFQSPSGSAFLAQSQGAATATFGTAGAASAIIKTNNTTAITIDTSQNVGIGAAPGAFKLDVTGETRLNGGITVKRTATAITYTALVTDHIIGVTSTAAARTINLPAAATAGVGKSFIIKDESGAAGTNNITIDPSGAETIDGAATFAINTNYGSVTIYTDGTSWFII
jgi:hypothetical protein